MAFQSELDVINDMLATKGESPLNQIEDDHPDVASGLRKLATANWREQAKGWWFNTEVWTATVNNEGFIVVPADAISVDPLEPSNDFVMRGRRLYDPLRGTYTFAAGTTFTCKLIRLIPFVDLPPNAASFVSICAVWDFQSDFDADEAKRKKLREDRISAYMRLNAEHIRNKDANLLTKGSTARKIASLGIAGTGTLLNDFIGNGSRRG